MLYFHGRFDRPFQFLSILIVFLIALFSFLDWRAFRAATREADQTRQILQGVRAVLSSLKDVETGEGGYLLTGDKKFLAPYKTAIGALPRQLSELWAAAVAPHIQVQQIARLQALTQEELEQVKRIIAVRDQEGAEVALAMLINGQGQATMANLIKIGLDLENTEYSNYKARSEEALQHANRSRIVTLIGCLVLVAWLFALGRAVDTVVEDRERLVHSVAESRQQLETTLASIGDAVIATDAGGIIRLINPVAAQLTQWSQAAANGRSIEEVMPVVEEDTLKPIESGVARVLRQKTMTSPASRILLVTKRGEQIPIEDSGAPIRDPDGKIAGVALVFRDISARRRAERELERWQQIFAQAAFGMFVFDPAAGTIRHANKAFADLHGYSVEELQGMPLSKLVPLEEECVLASCLGSLCTEGHQLLEGVHVHKDGTPFACLMDMATFPVENWRETYSAGYCSDISDRKQLEDALRESEERFRTLTGALPQLVWSSKPSGRIEYVNPLWRAYAGWLPETEAPGDPWTEVLHPEDHEHYVRQWAESIASGDPFDIQVRLRRWNEGDYRWFLCRGVALRNRNGEIIRWLGACTDIQDQVQSAMQLKQANEALRRSNDDLEQFAYAASHDLQEPLRMVAIYSQLLQAEYGNLLDDNARSYIEFAVNGSRRMATLLRDLLTYSRVANAPSDATAITNAKPALAEALLNLQTALEDSGAEVTIDPLPWVRVPDVHLVQLFQNLIGNSIKYRKAGKEGGKLVVEVKAKRESPQTWLFSVEDNGIGIEARSLPQIFGVFKRLHGQSFEGTGIGLALCQKIVERAGGKIWVESEVGRGSVFFFTLPACERETLE